MTLPYVRPRIAETWTLLPVHLADLRGSRVDTVTAGLAGVRSIDHGTAYDMGIRGDGDLGGLSFQYWEPERQRFSRRFVRIKPDATITGRKYLQPVGESPRLYFISGTTLGELGDASIPVFITEGEKKALALDRARVETGNGGVVVGIGGVWGWRTSPKELQPDGTLGKGKSRAIADLDLVLWGDRKVYLFFDSDAVTNWKVATAETALARELASRGANVFIVRLPGGAAWLKSA